MRALVAVTARFSTAQHSTKATTTLLAKKGRTTWMLNLFLLLDSLGPNVIQFANDMDEFGLKN